MKYVIIKEDGANGDLVNTFFIDYKQCRKHWSVLLREHFMKDCCENGKFLIHDFNEMSSDWTTFWNYSSLGVMGGGSSIQASSAFKEPDKNGKYYSFTLKEIK